MTTPVRLIVLTVIVLLAPVSADAEPLTLEQIYPESGLFADPASDFSFSHDGRFVAFEYRPFAERRHGNDVYVYDVETQAARRVTGVEVFAKFRRGARDVVRDREQALAADGPTTRPTRLAEALPDIGIFGVEEPPLPADDAERENAPEYNGINSFQWSPTADEMLVVAGGDVYRLTIDRDKWDADPDYRGDLERVTRTRRGESGVRYLPDGSGFTHWVDGGVMLVKFGTARQVQIDPPLRDDERLVGYRISPDGKRAVLLGAKNQTHPGQYTEVLMVRYGDRFAEPETLRRRLPDAEAPNGQMSIYLYDLTRNLTEGARPTRVYTRQIRGQRDLMVVPDWSPDSTRIAFAEYEQTSGRVTIWESVVGERSARPIYRFLHDGAPATPRRIVPHYLADSRRLAFITDRTGYRHLFVLDPLYEELRQLTHGRREIEVLGISPDAQRMFFTATVEDDPASETLHAVELDSGESWQIDDGEGRVTAAAVAPDGRHALFIRKHFGRPPFPVLATPDGEVEIGNFHPEPTHRETLARPEYFAFENRHGHTVHGHMFKPADWAATDRRPMLMFVYAGPIGSGRNMTARGSYNGDGYFFARYMAQRHGWVTCTIDPRGTSGFGTIFEKASFGRIGVPQAEDIIDATAWLIDNAGVDGERMALHGWSFGGFQTQYMMYLHPEVFAAGIAGAGPTQWENYDARYVTGVVGKFDPKKPDALNILPQNAKHLAKPLMLVHGVEDKNVLYQDTVTVYRKLLEADKAHLVELFLDPTGGHYLNGDVDRLTKYRKYEAFLLQHIGPAGGEATTTQGTAGR